MEPIYSKADEKHINKNIIENQQTNIQDVAVPAFRQEVVENFPVNVSGNNQISEHREVEINQNAQAVKERKIILAELEMKQNRKRLGDSALMKKIKAAAADIEDMLEMSVPLNQEKLDIAINALEIRYDTLISYCEKYEEINAGKSAGLGGIRLGFVKELRIVTELEKKNIKSAAEHVKGKHQDKNELTNWKEIVLRARSEENGQDGGDYKWLDRKENMDSAVALTKIAEYMGASDLFLKRDYFKVGNDIKLRSAKIDTQNYKTFADLYASEGHVTYKYTLNAFKKFQAMQAIEGLLGTKITPGEIYAKYAVTTKQVNGEEIKYAVIEDVIVRTKEHTDLVQDTSKNKSRIIIDRTMANRIMGMDPDVLSLLMTGLLDSSQRKILKKNLSNMKKRFHMKDSRVIGDNEWINEGEVLLRSRRKETKDKVELVKKNNGAVTDLPFSEVMMSDSYGKLDYGTMTKTHLRFERNQVDPNQIKQEKDALMLWYADERRKMIEERNKNLDDMTPEKRAEALTKQKDIDARYIQNTKDADEIILEAAEINHSLKRKDGESVPTFEWKDKSKEIIFTKVPSPEDVVQGSVGNCYLMSALSALAKNNPKLIMSMIEDRGSYALVKFPGRKPIPVSKKSLTIKYPNDQTAREYYSSGALWVQLIEKAYGRLHFKNNLKDKDLLKISEKYERRHGIINPNPFDEDPKVNVLLSYSVEITSSGNVADALANLTGQKYIDKKLDIFTVDNMKEVYKDMWDLSETGYEQLGIVGFNKEERYLRSVIEKPLKKELVRRYSKTYLNELDEIETNAYRNLTIENIKDTILDIKNWAYGKNDTDYIKLYKDVKKKFHGNDESFSDAKFMAILSLLASKLEVANDNLKKSFEHETEGIQVTRYTRKAKNIAAFMKEALKHGVLTTGTKKYILGKDGAGLNAEHTIEGMVEGHAYTIVDYRELQSTGQIMLTLRNPWGQGGMEYVQTSDANGKVITTGRQSKSRDDDGTFEIELNDYLRFFSHFATAEDVLNKPEVKRLYNKI